MAQKEWFIEMLDAPKYLESKWYNRDTDTIDIQASEKEKSEYRYYHAEFYIDSKGKDKIIYRNSDKVYLLGDNGEIERELPVDFVVPDTWDEADL